MRPVTPFLIAARIGLFLDHLARDVERQVGGIDQPAHEAQIARQDLGVVGDEDALDVELDAALAVGSNRSNGREPGTKASTVIFVPALGAVVDGQRRLVELAGDAAVEVGVFLRRDLGLRGFVQSAPPSAISAGSAPGLSTIAIGTGTWPDCSLTMRSSVAALGIGLGVVHQVQDDAGAARRRLIERDRRRRRTCPCRPTTSARPRPSRRGGR